MAIFDVVKCEVTDRELAVKFPSEQLRWGSQLVVYPAQTAFLVKGGKIYDAFTAGTYTIESANLPLLDKVVNLPFGGDSPFQAEVWFVHQLPQLDCKWGTSAPLQVEDPLYHVIVSLIAHGQYGFRVDEPRLFLEKMVGNAPLVSADRVENYARSIILSKLTTVIYEKLAERECSVLQINAQIDALSDYARECLADAFAAYGLCLEFFRIMAISPKADDPSFRKLKETKDAAAEIRIMGEKNYHTVRSFDVLDAAAHNEGGGAINAALGIGAGVGIGGAVGTLAAQTLFGGQQPGDTPPPLPPAVSYYLGLNGERVGPMPFDAVCQRYNAAQINADTLVWRKGMTAWTRLGDVADFSALLGDNCPPPLPNP